jgi:RNA polymerase sigma-70 factor (ECF subfamily)
VLRDVEDLTYEEITEITGLAEGTVKSRIHRARGMLREKVSRHMGEKV